MRFGVEVVGDKDIVLPVTLPCVNFFREAEQAIQICSSGPFPTIELQIINVETQLKISWSCNCALSLARRSLKKVADLRVVVTVKSRFTSVGSELWVGTS